MHILVVEDERALCETIVQSLRRLAYSVDFCFDGNVALELLESERFDLIVLDLNLPGADGMTVLRTLRKYDRETRRGVKSRTRLPGSMPARTTTLQSPFTSPSSRPESEV